MLTNNDLQDLKWLLRDIRIYLGEAFARHQQSNSLPLNPLATIGNMMRVSEYVTKANIILDKYEIVEAEHAGD